MPNPSTKERRHLRRILKRIPAFFQSEGVEGHGHVKNISKEGLFLRVHDLPEPGMTVRVVLEPEDRPKIEVEGQVMWTTAQLPTEAEAAPGFGMHFDRLSDEFVELFERILLH